MNVEQTSALISAAHKSELLEVELKAQLQLARTDRSAGNLPEAGIVDRGIRGAEYWVVECVFGLEANFEVHRFAEEELFSQG